MTRLFISFIGTLLGVGAAYTKPRGPLLFVSQSGVGAGQVSEAVSSRSDVSRLEKCVSLPLSQVNSWSADHAGREVDFPVVAFPKGLLGDWNYRNWTASDVHMNPRVNIKFGLLWLMSP